MMHKTTVNLCENTNFKHPEVTQTWKDNG